MTDQVFNVTVIEKEEVWDNSTKRVVNTRSHIRLDKKISAPSEDIAKILAYNECCATNEGKGNIKDVRMIVITCGGFC